ncbi:hypothetical protein HXY33_03635 [Candidatus Bathyarchaeota archaeon]|nr:hypothetical protein [Candidatus Bathyarchaeota archaeon]
MSRPQNLFQQALLEAVDNGLLTLGESGRKAVYFHLQNIYSLKKEDIADKPEVFAEGLRKIFGVGAAVIEKATVKSLYEKLGIKYEEKKNHDFMTYIRDAQQILDE